MESVLYILTAVSDALVAEVLEAVHHLDTSYAAFYTGMTTHKAVDNNVFVRQSYNIDYRYLLLHIIN